MITHSHLCKDGNQKNFNVLEHQFLFSLLFFFCSSALLMIHYLHDQEKRALLISENNRSKTWKTLQMALKFKKNLYMVLLIPHN